MRETKYPLQFECTPHGGQILSHNKGYPILVFSEIGETAMCSEVCEDAKIVYGRIICIVPGMEYAGDIYGDRELYRKYHAWIKQTNTMAQQLLGGVQNFIWEMENAAGGD